MCNSMLDMCFENSRLKFGFDVVVKNSEEAEEVKRTISNLYTIQEALYSNFLCGEQ